LCKNFAKLVQFGYERVKRFLEMETITPFTPGR
jgi:hypothetical protein